MLRVTVDAVKGTLQIAPADKSAQGRLAQGLSVLPSASDGSPNTNPPDTFQAVNTFVSLDELDCGAPDLLCAQVRLDSFFDTEGFENVHVQIVSMVPAAGWEALNSDSFAAVDDTYGLWSYGTIEAGNSSQAFWVFPANGPGGQFTFFANVIGDCLGGCEPHQADGLFACGSPNNSDGNLHRINPATGSTLSSVPLDFSTSGDVNSAGCRALASDPVGGSMFISYSEKDSNSRLGTINTLTGVVTDVGPIGTKMVEFAFTPDGQLWGVNSDSVIHKIDKTTGTPTFQVDPEDEFCCGYALEYDPASGLLFWWNGGGDGLAEINVVTLDPVTLALSSSPDVDGDEVNEPGALAYDPTRNTLITTFTCCGLGSNSALATFTPTADPPRTFANVGTIIDNAKGLAFHPSPFAL